MTTEAVKPNGSSWQRKPEPTPDTLPPHSAEMERGVLGCVLASPVECMEKVVEAIKGRDAFYELKHQMIYAALLEMFDAKQPIEILTLHQKIQDKFPQEDLGGITYLNELLNSIPSAHNLPYYLEVLVEKHALRKIVQVCHEVSQKAHAASSQSDELMGIVERDIMGLSRSESSPIVDGRGLGNIMIEDCMNRLDLRGKLSGADTGFVDLNKKTHGLQYKEQCIIGARPSQGKTALGLAIFNHNVFNGIPALFVSLEMSLDAIARRILSSRANIPLETIISGNFTESDIAKINIVRESLIRAPMHTMDGVGGLGVRNICNRVRRHILKYDIKLVVIDYLQKIRPEGKHEKRTYEVGDVSGRLKALAVETGVALITLAQLNRDNVKDQKPRPPRLSDFADSGQIERDADLALLLQKEEGFTRVLIAKHRDGETGGIRLRFNAPYCRFENYAEDRF